MTQVPVRRSVSARTGFVVKRLVPGIPNGSRICSTSEYIRNTDQQCGAANPPLLTVQPVPFLATPQRVPSTPKGQ